MAVAKDDVEILKPRTDKREYRRIVLKNSLQVLLISDPETNKCAASMNVSVGSFSDPDGLEGLAHLLEHMLLYASDKYPLKDGFSKYIKEHGGRTKAFFGCKNTNYHFRVNADAFEEALDRFVQFFIEPLMPAEAIKKKIKTVDSEYKKNSLSDAHRMNQLQKHLSMEGHPYHKFSTGNWHTLELRPEERGVDTRHELLKFYEQNYSANLMHLVVYTKESLDEIQSMVEDKFQEIRNSDCCLPSFPGQPCMSGHLQILVRTVPIKKGNKLRIVWPITPAIRYYKEGPCRYLGHLIVHEAEGSLFYALRKLEWATGLSAGEGEWTSEFSFFNVVIDLTDAGHDHMQDVVALLFNYIQLLQNTGVCKWIFDELSAVYETNFHHQDEIHPIDYVVNIALNMQIYPPKDWLVGSSLPSNFNQGIIQMVLDELSPDNVRIFWESEKFQGHTDMVEPWYGTAYSIEKVTTSMIQEWMSSAPNENLHLPAPNIFIPTDLSLKDPEVKVKYPVLLRESSYSRLWYKRNTLLSPKAYVIIGFNSPYADYSPRAHVLTTVFTLLVMDYLNEYAYYTEVAGLHYDIRHANGSFEVTVGGYNHKLRILLETIVDKIANFEVLPDRFFVIKEQLTEYYENHQFEEPYMQTNYYFSALLDCKSCPVMEGLEVLPNIKAEDLATFAPVMLSRAFLNCYIGGNIECAEAESMIKYVEGIFFEGSNPICQPSSSSQPLTNRIVKLENGVSYFYSKEGRDSSDDNSALLHYIQVHQDDFMLNVKLQLFHYIVIKPAYFQLVGVEGLGGHILIGCRNDFGIHALRFHIQSTKKSPKDIYLIVEAFLKMFETQFYKMSHDEFKRNVNALIEEKLKKQKNLVEESRFYWEEICAGTIKFDWEDGEVEALKQLTQQELICFFNQYIKIGAPQRRTLSVGVIGKGHLLGCQATKTEAVQLHEIDDIDSFKRSLPLYESFRGGEECCQMQLKPSLKCKGPPL
ncbi:hypothetical protein SLA2020_113820 [Shorea laevis]